LSRSEPVIKSIIIRTAIVLAGILVVLLGRGFFFYSGFYSPPPSEMPSYEHIAVPPAPSVEFIDSISDNISQTVLIDLAHDNNFDVEELNVLMLRLVSRGLAVKFFGAEGDLEEELLGEEEPEEADQDEDALNEEEEDGEEENLEEAEEGEEGEDLEEELMVANALIVVAPQEEFSSEEKETINEFVENGGKLLLIADPTRHSRINSLSLDFGLIFEPDYLYNMKENEINYRNIFVTEFEENEITKSLEKIVLYTTGSISSADGGIAFVDQNTFSSLVETRKKLSPIALAEESKVLAISDLTFMTEPYNGILDNNKLIANIADWLVSPIEEEEEAESTEKD
jgi:hypothetical protein